MNQTSVISTYDLERIRNKVARGVSLEGGRDSQLAHEKEMLQQRSRARMQKWGNTHEALQEKELKEMKAKFDVEEAARVVLDKEAEKLANAERDAVLNRAERLLYQQNDRVKGFNSALLQADALREREAQIAIKRQLADQEKKVDAYWFKVEQSEMAKKLEREERELEHQKNLAKTAQRMQREQLADVRKRKEQHKMEEAVVGRQIREQCIREVVEDQQKADAVRQRAKKNQADQVRANRELQKLREREAAKEKLEEDRVAEQARVKAQREAARRKREAERLAAKKKAQQDIIDAQTKRLAAMKSDEDARIESQVKEADEKAAAREDEKQRRIKQGYAAMMAAREEAARARDRAAEDERKERERLRAEFERRNQEIADEEHAEFEARRRKEAELKAALRDQMRLKEAKAKARLDEERAIERETAAVSDLDMAKFQEYAMANVRQYAAEGKSLKPLVKHLPVKKKTRSPFPTDDDYEL